MMHNSYTVATASSFAGVDRKTVLNALKNEALTASKTTKNHWVISHNNLKNSCLVVVDEAEQERMLRVGLAALTWVAADGPPDNLEKQSDTQAAGDTQADLESVADDEGINTTSSDSMDSHSDKWACIVVVATTLCMVIMDKP